MQMEKYLNDRIIQARDGREYWLKLVERYEINSENCVLLMPGCDRSINEAALIYMKEFLDKRNYTSAIILTSDTWVIKQQKKYSEFARIRVYSQKKVQAIMQFYCLYEFTSNLIIASLTEPSGRLGVGVVDKKGITPYEAFAGIVYGLYR